MFGRIAFVVSSKSKNVIANNYYNTTIIQVLGGQYGSNGSIRHHVTVQLNNSYINYNTTRIQNTIHRYYTNISKLYAKYLIQVAIATAALLLQQANKDRSTKLEKNSKNKSHEKPLDWNNWERKDWSNELYRSLGSSKIERIYNATKRIIQLSILISPLTILYPLSYISTTATNLTWKYSLWSIEQAGPTYIKLIQWATTRQDLFSTKFCNYFGKLRNDTIGHSWNETIQILKEETILQQQQQQQQQLHSNETNNNNKTIKSLGENDNILQRQFTARIAANRAAAAAAVTDVTKNTTNNTGIDFMKIIQIDKKPIGSGCIAQVYHGILLEDINNFKKGTEIAVKVQHPNIFHAVCCDFYILSKVAYLLESIPYLNLHYLSIQDTINQFRDIMLPQLNLQLEAQHLQRFNRNFMDDDNVEFPIPIIATNRILIETFLHGKPIMDYLHHSYSDRQTIAMLGLRTTLKMIFLHDFIHGDLHPGNLLVSGSNGKFKLHLLDCGLVVEMGPDQHVNLVKILGAFVRKNGTLAGQLMVDTSSLKEQEPTTEDNGTISNSTTTTTTSTTRNRKSRNGSTQEDVDAFVQGIAQIVIDDQDNNFIEKVGEYITDICYLACNRRVKLEPAFINAALAVEIIEGIATALDPALIVTNTAIPMVIQAEMMHRLPKLSKTLW